MVSPAEFWGGLGAAGAVFAAIGGVVVRVVSGRIGHIETLRIGAAEMKQRLEAATEAVARLEARAEREEAERREIREALARIAGLLDGFEARIKAQVNAAVVDALRSKD